MAVSFSGSFERARGGESVEDRIRDHTPTVSPRRLGIGNRAGHLTLAGDQRTRSFPETTRDATVSSPTTGPTAKSYVARIDESRGRELAGWITSMRSSADAAFPVQGRAVQPKVKTYASTPGARKSI